MNKTVKTTWQVSTFAVWGNAVDGFEVNDINTRWTIQATLNVITYNENTAQEFYGAELTDRQIKRIIGFQGEIEVLGDDTHYDVNDALDGYPLASLYCLSHESLSPIRKAKK